MLHQAEVQILREIKRPWLGPAVERLEYEYQLFSVVPPLKKETTLSL